MKVITTTGKNFIVKVRYNDDYHTAEKTDEFGRVWYTDWNEKTTEVAIYEYTKNKWETKVIVKGIAHCSYKDTFSKKIGKKLAYTYALAKMLENNLITQAEHNEMSIFDLNSNEFKAKVKKA